MSTGSEAIERDRNRTRRKEANAAAGATLSPGGPSDPSDQRRDPMSWLRRTASLALLVAMGPSFRPAGATPGEAGVQKAGDAAQIEQLERDRQDAFVRNDVGALDSATAEDYTTINGSGKLSTKPQMMENLRQGKTKVLSVTLDGLKARIYGDVAV